MVIAILLLSFFKIEIVWFYLSYIYYGAVKQQFLAKSS